MGIIVKWLNLLVSVGPLSDAVDMVVEKLLVEEIRLGTDIFARRRRYGTVGFLTAEKPPPQVRRETHTYLPVGALPWLDAQKDDHATPPSFGGFGFGH